MSDLPKLTTTSYAVLGLLSIRSWTSYELTQQMGRSLGRFWPRAESKLYEEPKKLVAYGLAQVSEESVGRRRRSRYAITDNGRRELRNWLRQSSQPPSLESEHLLKVFLGDQAGKSEMLETLKELQTWAERRMTEDAQIAKGYLEGDGTFPHRAAVLALMGRYSSDFALMTQQWAQWAQNQVSQWPDIVGDGDVDWEQLKKIAERP